jgi:hypothetical protein
MGPFDFLLHLLNFMMPALGVAALASAGAKLMWRKALAAVRWRRLFGFSFAAGLLVLVLGLILFGRDGRMATYGALVLATALALWWAGFRGATAAR